MATLGEQAIGSIVKLNVNGVATNFIVAHQGLPGTMYDSSCDGVWLLKENSYGKLKWDDTDNDYGNSYIHGYLNNTFVNLFDDDVRDVIKTVKIPFTNGTGATTRAPSTGANGISTRIFLLAHAELGYTQRNVEGSTLDFFDGSVGDGAKIGELWWLRSPNTDNNTEVRAISKTGGLSSSYCANQFAIRPALILPFDVQVSSDGMIGASKTITGSVNINGVQRELTGKGYINIGGVLRDLTDSQGDIGGILKSLKG